MSNPLNPVLFRQLQKCFGSVAVSNAGEAMLARYRTNEFKGGKNDDPELQIEHAGEYYRVNCDRCNDTRKRLWINHMFGVRNKEYRQERHLFLAVCYNENCYAEREHRNDLFDLLTENPDYLDRPLRNKGRVVPESERVMTMPGPVTPLHKLPPDHPANRYLASRFFDPEKLSRVYRVCYCTDSRYRLAEGRIIAPIYVDGALKGWQARHVGEMNWKAEDAPPKWWTSPGAQRSRIIYNFDLAKLYETGIVVEGPGDVWATGPNAMGLLGSTMTNLQERLLLPSFRDHSLVLMLDPDQKGKEATNKLIARLQAQEFKKGFAVVWLPPGTDPGGLDRDYLRNYIKREASSQGVEVSFRKK